MADWRPMQTAPRNGRPCLLWVTGGPGGEYACVAYFDRQAEAWMVDGVRDPMQGDFPLFGSPIGWLPRPAPPDPNSPLRG